MSILLSLALAASLNCEITRNDEVIYSAHLPITKEIPADFLTPKLDDLIYYSVKATEDGTITASYLTELESYTEVKKGSMRIVTWDILGAEDDTYVLDCKITPGSGPE